MMKRIILTVGFAMVLAIGFATSATAQMRGGGFGLTTDIRVNLMMLTRNPQVAEEIKLTDEQKEKLQEATGDLREIFGSMRDATADERAAKMKEVGEKFFAGAREVLEREQVMRLFQINLQQIGVIGAVQSEHFAKILGLEQEQVEKIKAIGEEAAKARAEQYTGLREKMQDLSDAERGELFQKMGADREKTRKTVDEKVAKVLTEEQNAKVKEMKGEKFEMQRPTRPQGRRPSQQTQA